MRSLHHKIPKNKKDALRFVYFLDNEWKKCFEIQNKRDRCKRMMKVHRLGIDCYRHLKKHEQDKGLKDAVFIMETWLKKQKLSSIQ